LGNGTTIDRSSPVQVGSLTNWLSVAAAYVCCHAIKTDGTLWAWGRNYGGSLGLGDPTSINRSSPVQVNVGTTWSKVSSSEHAASAIKTDGTLWSWGRNNQGKLGLGDTTNVSSPVQVGALTTWLTVAAGYTNRAAIKTDGTMWAWGNGGDGRLGLGDTTNRSSPVQVGALTTWLTVAAGIYHTVAIG
jgi:alpha-tubulin suppressor-like RCC1 family protein